MERVLIITGGSKGIGKGIISAYLAHGYQVISISRTVNPELSAKGVTQIQFDLNKTEQLTKQFHQIFKLLKPAEIEKITLINNAGTLGQVGPIESIDASKIIQGVHLNTIAPMLASAVFIQLTKTWKAKKSIINITSGAAQKPYFGWSIYCSTKAALNMLTQTLAVEQSEVQNGVKVIAIAPGVVDTDMQSELRKSDKATFKDIDRFLALKADGALKDTETVGVEIYEIDHDDAVENGAVLRVKAK